MAGRPSSSRRLWVERCAVCDITSIRNTLRASFQGVTPERGNWPTVTVTTTWPDGRTAHQTVALTVTMPRFGGLRWWYVCPGCKRRAGKLYSTCHDPRLLCRLCRALVYECQYQKHPVLVYLRRLRKEQSPEYSHKWLRALWKAVQLRVVRKAQARYWLLNPGARRPSLALLRRSGALAIFKDLSPLIPHPYKGNPGRAASEPCRFRRLARSHLPRGSRFWGRSAGGDQPSRPETRPPTQAPDGALDATFGRTSRLIFACS